jgi:hypothetical protein
MKEYQMSIGTWFKALWSKFMNSCWVFLHDALDQATQIAIGQFSALAMEIVTTLASTDLTSEAKRLEAFKKLKDSAAAKGQAMSDSVANLLIELAVAKLKSNIKPA